MVIFFIFKDGSEPLTAQKTWKTQELLNLLDTVVGQPFAAAQLKLFSQLFFHVPVVFSSFFLCKVS